MNAKKHSIEALDPKSPAFASRVVALMEFSDLARAAACYLELAAQHADCGDLEGVMHDMHLAVHHVRRAAAEANNALRAGSESLEGRDE